MDERADVYSFGRLAYRVLTGQLPDGRYADPMAHAPQVGRALSDVIVSCLQEPREDRPASAVAAIERWKSDLAPAKGGAAVEETASGSLSPPAKQALLRAKIVAAQRARGDVAHVRDDLETLALVAKMNERELDDLIKELRHEHRKDVEAVQALREGVDRELSRFDGEIPEQRWDLLLEAAQALGLEKRLDDIVTWRRKAYRLERKSNADADSTTKTKKDGTAEASNAARSDEAVAEAEAETRRVGFLHKLVHGDYGLFQTYWIHANPVSLILLAGLIFLIYLWHGQELAALWAISFAYPFLATIGAYRASLRYGGPKLWTILARVACLLWIFPAFVLFFLLSETYAEREIDEIALKWTRTMVDWVPWRQRLAPPTMNVDDRFRDCDVCPEMVVLPSGSYRRGSLNGHWNEGPVFDVAIGSRFALGKYEVTYDKWDACVRDGGCPRGVAGDRG